MAACVTHQTIYTACSSVNHSHVEDLISAAPKDVALHILSHLTFPNLIHSISLTSKKWQQLAQDKTLQKQMINALFPYLSKMMPKTINLAPKVYYCNFLTQMNRRLEERKTAAWILDMLPEFFTAEFFSSLCIYDEYRDEILWKDIGIDKPRPPIY